MKNVNNNDSPDSISNADKFDEIVPNNLSESIHQVKSGVTKKLDSKNGNSHTKKDKVISPPERHWFWRIFFIFQWTFEWMTIPVLKGIFSVPQVNELPTLPKKLTAEVVYKRMARYWETFKNWPRPLVICVFRLVWMEYSLSALLNLAMRLLDLLFPLFLGEMLKVLQSNDESIVWKGYLYAVVIGVTKVIWSILMQMYNHYAVRSGMRARSGLISLLYAKSLRMQRRQEDVMTLISVDAMRVDIAFQFFHFSWTSIIQIIASVIFLAFLVGWATVAGVVVMLTVVPFQFFIGKLTTIFQSKALKWTDKRVKIISEIIGGIQLMKFYAWENEYSRRVNETRKKEVLQVTFTTVMRALNIAMMSIVPVFVSVATFVMYSLLGGTLDVSVVFPAISYFELMRVPLSYFPVIVNNTVTANVSLRRMEVYMREKEIQQEKTTSNHSRRNVKPIEDEDTNTLPKNVSLEFKHAIFEWPNFDDIPASKKKQTLFTRSSSTLDASESEQELSRIEDINFEVEKGKLVLVVGEVGSGKSSLLSAMLGEMKKVEGDFNMKGSISYVPQAAFLRNATVRDNILFSFPMDEERYQDAIYFSGLAADLEQLHGDMTEIGARGVNLSGGQKTRICLARAIFSNGDIYLLDDSLSALDASVGKFIFEECICGYLRDKTRIMVTHHLHYCDKADYIIVMDKGRIAEQGTFNDLMSSENGILKDLINTHVLIDEEVAEEETATEDVKKPEKKNVREGDVETNQGSTIIQKEERNSGRIKFNVIHAYAKAMGGWFWPIFIFLLCTITQIFLNAPDIWITLWSGNTITSLRDNNTINLLIYACLGVAAGIVVVIRDMVFFLVLLRASRVLHMKAFSRVIRAPMSWFEAQPQARIISRFSGDVDLTDGELIMNLSSSMMFFFQASAVCIVISVSTSGVFILPLIIISLLYFVLTDIYLRSSREYKRLDSITRSPMMSHFSETISGLSSVRAYKKEDHFFEEQLRRITLNHQAYYMMQGCTRWLGIRLDALGGILILLISICAFLIKDVSFIDASLLALGITYSLQFNRVMSWFIRNSAQAEVNLNSVERLSHYASREIPNEKPLRYFTQRPPKKWPQKGTIVFEDMHFRYRPELEDTLKGINLTIGSEQHVAIVGRTGSGKSSTILSLFRERELSGGKIYIDGVDISTIGLHDLREQLTIIPQTPTCFYGTVRSNLDPFEKHSDMELWRVLEASHLKPLIEKLGGLDATIEEGGANLSIGERSLLVLARALLRKRKILISDEASAAMDLALDAKIQETIRKEFHDCTTITIAHRIQTIIDSDMIIVLDSGKIEEIGSPKELLSNTNSIFFRMVRDTGETNQKKLLHIVFGDDFEEFYAKCQSEGTL